MKENLIMEKESIKTKKVEQLENEGLASYSFQKSSIGLITAIILFVVGIGSIFLYRLAFNLSILISIILGFFTWLVLGFIIDRIVVRIKK